MVGLGGDGRPALDTLGLDMFDGLRSGREASERGGSSGGGETGRGRLRLEKGMGGGGLGGLR